MELRGVTLTGVDQFVDLRRLLALSREFDCAEWGLLYSPKAAGREFRYPDLFGRDRQFVAELCGLEGVKVALHVCGAGVTELREGSNPALNELIRMVGRVQLNLRGPDHGAEQVLAMVRQVTTRNPSAKVIVQANKVNADLAVAIGDDPSIQWLWDASGGRGKLCREWPSEAVWRSMGLDGREKGFAGGLAPSNLRVELSRIAETLTHAVERTWLDMESSLRCVRDRFDLDLAKVVLLTAQEWCDAVASQARTTQAIRA